MEPHVCPWWLACFHSSSLRKLIQNPYKIFNGLLKPGQTVLDIGCGPGFFTVPMAEMVGENGRVIAADIQPKMLGFARRRAERAGLLSRIQIHECRPDKIGIEEKVDFVAALYVVHEVPNQEDFFKEIVGLLKPEGTLLVAEPKMHVSAERFDETIRTACAVGLKVVGEMEIKRSRTRLFKLDE